MKKALVAYFSASGVTEKMAKRLANGIGADLFRIVPEKPYTSADLNWRDPVSRSSLEMKDPDCRPALSGKIPSLDAYDVVFVGFPVWWYREPSIIDTFMEKGNFEGKTVVPFATSGMSDIGDSGKNMQRLAPLAQVEEGRRFPDHVSEKALADWAKDFL